MSPALNSPPGSLDEAYGESGRVRPLYERLLAALGEADLGAVAEDIDRHLSALGVTFGEVPFRLDPVPRLIDGEEWQRLERGLAQRVRALVAFVADAYGAREIVQAGAMPARVIDTSRAFEPWMVGVEVSPYGWVAGLDLVRGDDGVLRVLEDNMRTPSGIAYVVAARAALGAHLPTPLPAALRDPEAAFELLRSALTASAPADVAEPTMIVLSDGESNSAWFEHREIARRLALPLVHVADLSIRRNRLHATIGGERCAVDVVYRRTDEDTLRFSDGRPTWLAELLLGPVRAGKLAVVNPLGAGVADDKLVHAYVEAMIRFYLGQEPLIESVPTYDLGEADVRERVLPRLDEMVLKPRFGLGGDGVVICPHATPDDRERVARQVRAQPDAWVAQELVSLSTHPTVVDGRLEPRHVDLRPFVVGGGENAVAVPGGLTRVALGEGELVVNSSQDGGGKDTWVLA
jgi:uncharacterized circularly permuted ATP-grasp superfamily protein